MTKSIPQTAIIQSILVETKPGGAYWTIEQLSKNGITCDAVKVGSIESQLYLMDQKARSAVPLIIVATEQTDALSHLKPIRSSHADIPIIVILPELDDNTACRILEAGADDVVCQQSQSGQIATRIKTLVRRSSQNGNAFITRNGFEIEISSGILRTNGEVVALTAKEAAIIRLLAHRPKQVVSKKAIYDTLYAFSDAPPFQKVIDVHFHNIRKKLGAAKSGGADLVQTVPGGGYRLS